MQLYEIALLGERHNSFFIRYNNLEIKKSIEITFLFFNKGIITFGIVLFLLCHFENAEEESAE